MDIDLDVFIDSDCTLGALATLAGPALGATFGLPRNKPEDAYEATTERAYLQLRENALVSLDDIDFEGYRYQLRAFPLELDSREEWEQWAMEHGPELFQSLDRLGVPLMLVIDLERKLAEFWPETVPLSARSNMAYLGSPGLHRMVHVFIATSAGTDALAESVGNALGLEFERQRLVPNLDAYSHRSASDHLVLWTPSQLTTPPDVLEAYGYDLSMRPLTVNTRREWDQWIATRGRQIFDALKTLGCPLLVMDGEKIRLAEYRPESRHG